MENTIKIPTGVRVLAVLGYIGAVLGALCIVALTIAGSMFPFIGVFGIFIIIPLLIQTILSFMIARGLYRAKNWARILLVVLSGIALLSGIINLFMGASKLSIIGMLINAVIIWYLMFNESVKTAFTKKLTTPVPPQVPLPM